MNSPIPNVLYPGIILPQQPYVGPQSSQVQHEIIEFTTQGMPGILVSRALDKVYGLLNGRDDLMFENCGRSISIRFKMRCVLSYYHVPTN